MESKSEGSPMKTRDHLLICSIQSDNLTAGPVDLDDPVTSSGLEQMTFFSARG